MQRKMILFAALTASLEPAIGAQNIVPIWRSRPAFLPLFPQNPQIIKSSKFFTPRDVAAGTLILNLTRPCGAAVPISKAEHQKKRYEQQLAAQSKRSHIDFAPSSSVPAPSSSKHRSSQPQHQQAKERENPYYSQRHSEVGSRPRQRFHPYPPRGDTASNAYLREKARWG